MIVFKGKVDKKQSYICTPRGSDKIYSFHKSDIFTIYLDQKTQKHQVVHISFPSPSLPFAYPHWWWHSGLFQSPSPSPSSASQLPWGTPVPSGKYTPAKQRPELSHCSQHASGATTWSISTGSSQHQQTNASTPGFLLLLWWLTLSFGPLANAPEQRWGVGADTESGTHGDRHNSAVQCLCITTNAAPKLHNVAIHGWVEHHLYCSGGVFPWRSSVYNLFKKARLTVRFLL